MNAAGTMAAITIRATIFHRICMRASSVRVAVLNHTPPCSGCATPDERRASIGQRVPLALALRPTCRRYWNVESNPIIQTMKTTISLSTPAELETEALVVLVLDHA